MTVEASVTFKGPWDAVIKAFEGATFKANLEAEGRTAMKINLKILEGEVRKAIHQADIHGPSNAFMTLDLKAGRQPLVSSGQMANAVGSRFFRWNHGHVGIMARSGSPIARRAEAVHNGAVIQVTRKMFNMFMILHRLSLQYTTTGGSGVSTGWITSRRLFELWQDFRRHSPGRVFPKVTKGTIVVPERPFLQWALESKRTENVYWNFYAMVIRAIVRVPGIQASRVPAYRT